MESRDNHLMGLWRFLTNRKNWIVIAGIFGALGFIGKEFIFPLIIRRVEPTVTVVSKTQDIPVSVDRTQGNVVVNCSPTTDRSTLSNVTIKCGK